jgi:hypothetical protein
VCAPRDPFSHTIPKTTTNDGSNHDAHTKVSTTPMMVGRDGVTTLMIQLYLAPVISVIGGAVLLQESVTPMTEKLVRGGESWSEDRKEEGG